MSGQGLFFKSYKFVINGRGLLNNRITNVNFQFPVMGFKQDTRDKLKHLNIPEKPKRPLVPYLRFISDQRPEILKNNPNIKLTDVVKKCAEKMEQYFGG
ncbi:hypothetical protein NQ317_007358 [Molorchus minor]|uniref:HMG box domain-containing protein n=1 Tax=Molorchus minor TaxID=1323400 RepID=A0ABQ9JB96_9CUCU|nr:hypothetical protein NQ317_007358 [Molorchus minor]